MKWIRASLVMAFVYATFDAFTRAFKWIEPMSVCLAAALILAIARCKPRMTIHNHNGTTINNPPGVTTTVAADVREEEG